MTKADTGLHAHCMRHPQFIGFLRHCERVDATWEPDSPISEKTFHGKQEMHSAGECGRWTFDPELSSSGFANAAQLAKNFAEEPLVKFDIVVSSPYRRCIETAVLLCKELQVPIAIDPRLGEIQNASVMGDMSENAEHLHQSLVENVEYVKACGVELIGMEDFCGTALASDDLPAYPESLPKAFKRYVNTFERCVSGGKSILCVTHGMALVSIGGRFCPAGHPIVHAENPGMGDFFVCDVSSPVADSPAHRPKYAVVSHNFKVRANDRSNDAIKRSFSSPSMEQLSGHSFGSSTPQSRVVRCQTQTSESDVDLDSLDSISTRPSRETVQRPSLRLDLGLSSLGETPLGGSAPALTRKSRSSPRSSLCFSSPRSSPRSESSDGVGAAVEMKFFALPAESPGSPTGLGACSGPGGVRSAIASKPLPSPLSRLSAQRGSLLKMPLHFPSRRPPRGEADKEAAANNFCGAAQTAEQRGAALAA
jgi:broad specificity phosphatase PhoE